MKLDKQHCVYVWKIGFVKTETICKKIIPELAENFYRLNDTFRKHPTIMNSLSADQYLEAVDQKHQGTLPTLHNHHFLLQEDGKTYLYKKGTNAIVFKTESHSKLYAVRFFFFQENELFRRYVQLQDYLNNKDLSWKVPFSFFDKEYYPFLKMDWVEGFSFSEYLDTIIQNPLAIGNLQSKLLNLSKELEANGIGHGDLNLNHIRIARQNADFVLKLIDYDSIFIPEFKGRDSLRIGTAGFQHPMRLSSDFSERIDRFSIWIFLTALEAFKANPLLWIESGNNGYDKTTQLIFQFGDLAFPEQSSIFNELKSYNHDALNFYVDKLISYCNTRSADLVEAPELFGQKIITPTKKEEIKQKPEIIPIEIKKPSTVSVIEIKEQKAVEPKPNPAIQKTIVEKKDDFVDQPIASKAQKKDDFADQPIASKAQRQIPSSAKGNKKSRIVLIAAASVILILTSLYFIRPQSKKTEVAPQQPIIVHKNISTGLPKDSLAPVQKTAPVKPVAENETSFFTTSKITNSLAQLYQSYNDRKLSAILSNYNEKLDQYYDAAPVNRASLSGIMKTLFIKPYFYQCTPDWSTLHVENENNNLCNVTITLNEAIKTKKRSRQEKYTSHVQYTFNKNFKIVSEKSID